MNYVVCHLCADPVACDEAVAETRQAQGASVTLWAHGLCLMDEANEREQERSDLALLAEREAR